MTIITGNKGGGGSSHTPTEAPDSVQSVATAKILIALGEGEWAGNLDNTRVLFDGTPYGNADGTINFPDARWEFRPGTQAQEYIQGIPSVENEIAVNTELKSSAPWVRAVVNTQLSAVRIRFGWPALQQQKNNGDTVGYRIEYAIDVATDGGAYVEMLKAAIDDKTTSLYERSHRVNLPKASTGWQIRVRRLTENANSNRIADTMNIEAISEIIDAKLRYPGTALLYAEFNAKQFQSIPQISCIPDMAIIRVPDNYDPVRRTYTGTWTGGFKWAHSNNPAWVFYDLLLSERYGLGDRLESVQIDETELYRIAQYCDQLVPDGKGGSGTEPRFLCDVYIQSQEDAWTVLTDLAAVFRGMTYWGGEQIVTVCDMPEDVRYTFTRANVVNGQFTYSSSSEKTRYTTAAVSWSDPGNHYSDTVEMVSEQRLVRRYGINQTQIAAIGCTRQSEANRRGRWTLLSNSSDNTVSFSVGLDGAIPMPGRLIAVADYRHANASIGGRISAVDGRKITLDREPRAQAGDRLQVNLPSGTTQARTVQAVNGHMVTVTTAYSETPQAEAVWAVDADDLMLQLFRVVSIRDNGDNSYEITAVAHDPDKYARIDTGARLEERPISIMPPTIQPGPKNIGIGSYSTISQNIAITIMRVSWDAVESAIAYEAEWRKDSGNWVSVPRTSAQGFEVSGIYSGRYLVRVRAVNASDIASLWATSVEVELKGKEGRPPVPVGFAASSNVVFGVRLTWGFSSGAEDTLKTVVQYSHQNDGTGAVLLTDVPYPQREYLQPGMAAGVGYFYRACLVDRTGNQSDWTGWVRGAASSDANDVLSYLTGEITQTQLGQELLKPIEDASKLEDMWSVKVAKNANGKQYMAGIGAGVENTPSGMQTQVLVVANRFAVLNTVDGTGTAVSTPFAIDNGQVFMNSAFIKDGTITNAKIGDYIQSTSYGAGVGWRINKNGTADFQNATVRGGITATSGTLNNVTINESCTVKRLYAEYIYGDIFSSSVAGKWAWGSVNTSPGVRYKICTLKGAPFQRSLLFLGASVFYTTWRQNMTIRWNDTILWTYDTGNSGAENMTVNNFMLTIPASTYEQTGAVTIEFPNRNDGGRMRFEGVLFIYRASSVIGF
ncbi:putative phage tail protein [Enterobacillus tribolii]|uniref:Putative phage tail protein n=2 Tax=Enterobacillus tribolii TaxID=1487935 RepID=A0A370R2R5_9GAMM|nr:host specificity protein J [Enterobacillus tribolii]RDK96730.1 putative phage tail protein [Enterobacillus tribolii]